MRTIDELQKELSEWIETYAEAEADYNNAEERMEKAQRMCKQIEKQINEETNSQRSEKHKMLRKVITDTMTRLQGDIDFYIAIIKASLFASDDPSRQTLQCVAITENQVISTDGHRAYVASVSVPKRLMEAYVKFEISDILEKREPTIVNVSGVRFVVLVLDVLNRAGREKKIELTKAAFESKIRIIDVNGTPICVLDEPFIKMGFNKNFIDDALTVMDNGKWIFEQDDVLHKLLISNQKETIIMFPVHLPER